MIKLSVHFHLPEKKMEIIYFLAQIKSFVMNKVNFFFIIFLKVSKFSEKDAHNYEHYERMLENYSKVINHILDVQPYDVIKY